jgi:hypothetical protein
MYIVLLRAVPQHGILFMMAGSLSIESRHWQCHYEHSAIKHSEYLIENIADAQNVVVMGCHVRDKMLPCSTEQPSIFDLGLPFHC